MNGTFIELQETSQCIKQIVN